MFDLEILSRSAVASSPSTLTSSISALDKDKDKDKDTIYYRESTENIEGRVQKIVTISVLAPDRSLLLYQHM